MTQRPLFGPRRIGPGVGDQISPVSSSRTNNASPVGSETGSFQNGVRRFSRLFSAQVNEEPLRAEGPGFGLEVVGVEGAKPERLIPVLDALQGKAYRMRSVGSIAISLCYVGGGRFDAMLTGRASRSVDAAAGQLVAREGGAVVAFAGEGLDVSLDLDARYHVAAALDSEMLATVLEAQRFAEPAPEAAG